MVHPVSVMLLSDFCSGSSALQSELTRSPEINRVVALETQYWCKAAAMLGMPQPEIMSSTLPMGSDVAKRELIDFLSDNLADYSPPKDDEEMVFEGWQRLCNNYSPFFFEKSPHHLHYWSALQLIHQCMERLGQVEFKFIGLVRNPLDTIYSRWRRWRNDPYKAQWLWYSAYNNLLRFKELVGERLIIHKYEDLVRNESALFTIFAFLEAQPPPKGKIALHAGSIERWRKDLHFAFQLDPTIIKLGESLGYNIDEMQGRKHLAWPLYWRFTKLKFHIGEWKRRFIKK
jgi:hypothetical protein